MKNQDLFICNAESLETSHANKNGIVSRFEYKGHFNNRYKMTGRQIRALIREGEYCFPGGYAVIPFTSDGALLCVDCIRENLTDVLWSIRNQVSDGWRVVGLDIYYGVEDNGEFCQCDNCGKDWEDM